jgi:cell shape-determining protein MreC
MNPEKVKLIVKNMELLVQQLKLELQEQEQNKENIISLEDMVKNYTPNMTSIDDYEPDYFEEE